MANSLGTIGTDVIARRALDYFAYYLPSFSLIGTDLSERPVALGEKVIAKLPVLPEVKEYSGEYAASDAAHLDVEVVMNKHKHCHVEFTADELSRAEDSELAKQIVEEKARGVGMALAKQVWADYAALVTPANFANEIVVPAANFDRSALNRARMKLNSREVDSLSRFAILGGDAMYYLMEDDRVISREYNPKTEGIAGVTVENIASFKEIHEVVSLPTTDNLLGFAAARQAIALVTRLPADAALIFPERVTHVDVRAVRHPRSGLTLLARDGYEFREGKLITGVALMYGVGVGASTALERFVSASTS